MQEKNLKLVLKAAKLVAKVCPLPGSWLFLGTQRRKKKHVNVQNVNEDKKLKSAIKKFGMENCSLTDS